MLSHSAIQFIITSNSLATLQHRVLKNIVLHLISTWDTFALPVVTASCDGGCRGNGSWDKCGLNVDIGFSSDFFVNVRFSLGPGLSIFVKSSGGNWGSNGDGSNRGIGVSSSYRGNWGSHGYGSNSITCGSSIPCSGKLGFGSLNLRGISNEVGGSAGHSQRSKNNEALHFFFR